MKIDDIYYYNYKEPLREFEDGFGYMGTVAYSKDKQKIQCHFCGRLLAAVTTSHIWACDGIKKYLVKHPGKKIDSVDKYKEELDLNKTTALVGEITREKLIKIGVENFVTHKADFANNFRRRRELAARNKMRTGEKQTLESRNKRGTCPDQLLDRVRKCREILGHVPSKREFCNFYKGKYLGILYEVFGSWVNAVKKAGYTPVSVSEKYQYTDQQLLDFLIGFYKMHGRLSRRSDHGRGLMPVYSTYFDRFGSINNARELAGLPVLIQIGRNEYHEVIFKK